MTIGRAVRALEARITDKEIEHPSLISSFLHKLVGSTDNKPGLRRGGRVLREWAETTLYSFIYCDFIIASLEVIFV